MKKLCKILIAIICLIIPAQVIAAPVPILMPIPISTPSAAESTLEKETNLKYDIGVYRLGQQPLILGLSKEDYSKLDELFKGIRVWNEDSIFSNILDTAKRAGNIIVYDKNNKKGYEVLEKQLNEFLVANKLENKTQN